MIVGLNFGHLLFKEITSFVGITFPSLTLIVLIEEGACVTKWGLSARPGRLTNGLSRVGQGRAWKAEGLAGTHMT